MNQTYREINLQYAEQLLPIWGGWEGLYYADAARIASKIGSGNANPITYTFDSSQVATAFDIMKEELTLLTGDTIENISCDFTQITHLQGDSCKYENALYFYHGNHLSSTQMITDINGDVAQAVLYTPWGSVISEYKADWMLDTIPRYLFNSKEKDEESGLYYYEARYYSDEDIVFRGRDVMFEKYFWISPYAYCGNNPVILIDPTGMEVDVAELYKTDKNGKLINPEQVKAFEAYMGTKTGRAEIAKYAKEGQTIAGHTFDSDGEYHKAGADISFKGGEGLHRSESGNSDGRIVNGRLKIDIAINSTNDIGAGVETIAHETLIHGRQCVKDFRNNGKLDFSHAYKGLNDWLKNRGMLTTRFVHHYQESQSDKVMEKVGIPLLREYYKNAGIQKSESDLKYMIKFSH